MVDHLRLEDYKKISKLADSIIKQYSQYGDGVTEYLQIALKDIIYDITLGIEI